MNNQMIEEMSDEMIEQLRDWISKQVEKLERRSMPVYTTDTKEVIGIPAVGHGSCWYARNWLHDRCAESLGVEYSYDLDIETCDKKTADWWVNFANEFIAVNKRIAALIAEYGASAVDDALHHPGIYFDLGDEPAIMHALLDDVFGKKYMEKNKD